MYLNNRHIVDRTPVNNNAMSKYDCNKKKSFRDNKKEKKNENLRLHANNTGVIELRNALASDVLMCRHDDYVMHFIKSNTFSLHTKVVFVKVLMKKVYLKRSSLRTRLHTQKVELKEKKKNTTIRREGLA